MSADVCEGLETGSRHMRLLGDGFAMIFVAQKSITCLKLSRQVRDRSRPVRDACEDFAMPCERKTVANSSHPSEIGVYMVLNIQVKNPVCSVRSVVKYIYDGNLSK